MPINTVEHPQNCQTRGCVLTSFTTGPVDFSKLLQEEGEEYINF